MVIEATVYVTKDIKRKIQKLKQIRRRRSLVDVIEQAIDAALRDEGIDPRTLRRGTSQ